VTHLRCLSSKESLAFFARPALCTFDPGSH